MTSSLSGIYRSSIWLASWPASSYVSICFAVSLPRIDWWLVVSDVWSVAVNTVVEWIILRMLGTYVDCCGILVPVLWVPLHYFDVKCTLVRHSGRLGRAIHLFNGRCSVDNWCALIDTIARAFLSPNGMSSHSNCWWEVPTTVFCPHRPPWFRWCDSHYWGPVEHLRDQ
jgi:hypothetical protein